MKQFNKLTESKKDKTEHLQNYKNVNFKIKCKLRKGWNNWQAKGYWNKLKPKTSTEDYSASKWYKIYSCGIALIASHR